MTISAPPLFGVATSLLLRAAQAMTSAFACLIVCGVLASTMPAQKDQAHSATKSPAVTAQPRIAEWWFARHAEKIGLMSKGDIDLLMVGDSITNNFDTVGLKVWQEHFVPRKAINLGFGGDRTNHVLWRLDHLPKLKVSPKGAVVMIGTNNICWGSDKPQQAAHGVQAIARKLNSLYPEMKILVLGVFPRRREASHAHRKQIVELNSYLPGLVGEIPNAKFLDIGKEFLDERGFLSKEMMPDTTHPSAEGHRIWAAAIKPELDRMLGAVVEQAVKKVEQTDPKKAAKPKGKANGDKVYLMKVFRKNGLLLGKSNKGRARIVSGPKAVALMRGKAPGKTWQVALGKHRFRVSIENVTKLGIQAALKKIERVPPLYRRCFEIVSEQGKDGIAFYKSLGGAAAHGGQQYLNIIDRADAKVMVHEAGHIMEQRARDNEKDILTRWERAIAKDDVSISRYGDRVSHEDLAEFAALYAFCLDSGNGELTKLKRKSPARYALWKRILKLAKAN